MVTRMSAQEARAKFSDLLGIVHYGKDAVIIEKQGRTFAVVISPEDYQRLLKDRGERFKVFDELRARNPGVTSEQAMEEALSEIAALRREKRWEKVTTQPQSHKDTNSRSERGLYSITFFVPWCLSG